MNWLARLKKIDIAAGMDATETTKRVSVGFVAPDTASAQKTMGVPPAANDPALDPDRWCWPHSDAMTGAEIDRMVSRVERFVARGLDLIDATVLADSLVLRDRDGDDRRLCLECDHLRAGGRCGVRTVADVPAGRLIDALPILQRCNQFKKTTP